MELRHLKYFVTIADEGSITKAAEKLLIAQPPLSRQLQYLEEEIGTPLFVRGRGRQTVLTEAGERFLPYARQVLMLTYRAILAARGEEKAPAPSAPSHLMSSAAALRSALDDFIKEAENNGI